LAVALAIAIPCVWQSRIQANDLSSHLYNAWLCKEVSAGHLEGLYVVPQSSNILFDTLLSLLMQSGSAAFTEHAAVLIAVEIFFWGCFTLASVLSRRPTWDLTPFLALLTYGAVFRMGFFNFYLSVGFCAFAIALIWRNTFRRGLLAIPLLVLAFAAHLLPVLWAIGVIGYILVARRLTGLGRLGLTVAGVLSIAGAAYWMSKNIPGLWQPGQRLISIFGANQVQIFGAKYTFVAGALLCVWAVLLIRRIEPQPAALLEIPFLLWILSAATTLVMPDAIHLSWYSGSLTYIAARLSLFSAILLCVVLGRVRMNTFERIASGLLCVVFFSFSYVDERAITAVEQKMIQAVATLPQRSRVVSMVADPSLRLPALDHLIDRVCIGRCFDFGDYEPATSQFRLRARLENSYVMANIDDIIDFEHSKYVWRRTGIQLYQLLPCQGNSDICAAAVQSGEQLRRRSIASTPQWWR
jgi:hypothetical protein